MEKLISYLGIWSFFEFIPPPYIDMAHSKLVKEWLKEHEHEIELFYLPSYSPELNPDEYLNCDLKAGVHSGPPARNKPDLKKKTIFHLRMLQKKPRRVMKYFKHPKILYAA